MSAIQRTAAAVLIACAAHTSLAQVTGPSSSQSPYLVSSQAAVQFKSLFTVGDTVGGYRMVGILDGLGAFDNGNGTYTVVANHELGQSSGIVRAHGSTGAFVSRWVIDTATGAVISGRDHNTAASDVNMWNGSGFTPGTTQFGRFCSADLPEVGAFNFPAGGVGTSSRIFMNGEEIGPPGRAFAHVLTGSEINKTYELPHLGDFSWENSVASPFSQLKTVVVGLDDSSVDGQIYVYIGEKRATGNEVEKAGLIGGNLYGIRLIGVPQVESRSTVIPAGTRFELFNEGNAANLTGNQLNAQSVANGVQSWLRPEDGAWDPRPGRQNDFYFLNTDRINVPGGQVGRSRMYRLRFDDIANPLLGGTVTMLISTLDGPQMMDNMCVDSLGRIIIQEDIGGNSALGKIWMYAIDTGGLIEVARHDPARFTSGQPGFLTIDEEASGVIDVFPILGNGWYLLDVQAHFAIPGELVEGGQLLAMFIDPAFVPACPADFNGNSGPTVQDIFDFLADWEAQIAGGATIIGPADFNGSGDVTVQDIFDFLFAWNRCLQ
jgi:hypothetical protein